MIAATGFRAVDWLLIAVILVLLAVSGLLALAETSLVRTSRVKAKALLDEHRRGARQLVRLVEHPEQFLNPVLLLVLICQLVSATLVGVLASRVVGRARASWSATVFEVVVIFVIFEAVPKNWAVHNPERAALFSAPLVTAVVALPAGAGRLRRPHRAGQPADRPAAGRRGGPSANVTESELLAMADVAHAEDVIEHTERAFIHSIIDFGDAVVREVMVPRPDMVAARGRRRPSAGPSSRRWPPGAAGCRSTRTTSTTSSASRYAKDLMRAERDGHGADAGAGATSARPTSSPRPSG